MNSVSRGVTSPLNYVLILGMVSLLVSGLIFGVGGVVDGEQERTTRAQLTVVGNQFANDLTAVEQLGRHGGGSVSLVSDLPREAVGVRYTVEVVAVGGSRYELRLASTSSNVATTVPFTSRTPITPSTVRGGSVVITYTHTPSATIEVTASG